MSEQQSVATVLSQEDITALELAYENFNNAMSPITIEEKKMQERSVYEALPNKYTRYELTKRRTLNDT